MDAFAARQSQINRQKEEAAAGYPLLWSKMVYEWAADGAEDRVWMMYAANYLFRTGSVRWALDPLTLKQRIPSAPEVQAAQSLSGLSFVLLTHRHPDHLDFNLIRALRELPICGVIPEALPPLVIEKSGLSEKRVVVAHPAETIQIEGITITPFPGLHWDKALMDAEGKNDLPAAGYLVVSGGKRWLFPGDTRTYDAGLLPDFGAVDGVFAHLWLGRGCALYETPPALEVFCRFCVALQPRHLIVTHLHEYGRGADDFWDEGHYQKVYARCRSLAPQIEISSLLMGESLSL